MLVYKATNQVNGKIYIGITTKTLERRKAIHKRDSKRMDTYFYRAIRKYGFEKFSWEIIDETAENIDQLHEKEKYYIKKYDTFDNKTKGYNTQSGGRNLYDITKEEKLRRSQRVSGKGNPMYGVSSPMKGKKFTEEHRRKISNALKDKERPSIQGGKHYNSRKIVNVDTGEIFNSLTEAGASIGVTGQMIGKVCMGKRKTAKGYRWNYL